MHMTTGFRRLALACLMLMPAGAAQADVVDKVISQLRADGYSAVTVSRTLLGRARIVGQGAPGAREIVVDRRTGEVLRDWRKSDDDDDDDHDSRGRGRGRGGDDRDDRNDDDRDRDDDRDDDNSGSGGGDDDDDD